MAPDVDGLVGEDEEAARRQGRGEAEGGAGSGGERGPVCGGCPHLLRQSREGR